MALVKCPECGKEISDKAPVCIHCGYPMDIKDVDKSGVNDKGYSLELLDYGSKKVQVATIIKNTLNMKDVEALELVANVPCYIFNGKKDSEIISIIQRLDALPIEYNLYLDGNLKRHKKKDEIDKQENTNNSVSNSKKLNCPKCNALISETARSCSQCGFDGIGSYLLQLEKEKQSKIIDYTHDYEPVQSKTQNIPKCPTCQSADIKKVSAMSKAGSVALWGLFSQKVKKQWHCNNCGSEW